MVDLLQHLDNYRRIPVLAFDEAGSRSLPAVSCTRLRVGTIDLKIAAIVLFAMRSCSPKI